MRGKLLDIDFVREHLPCRNPEGNKGDFGKLLCICGSYGMAGAAIMAAKGALRSGVGLVYIFLPKEIYPIVAPMVPEAVFIVADWEKNPKQSRKKLTHALEICSAVVMGCGLGELAREVCEVVLKSCKHPIIIDADGLNYAAKNPFPLKECKAPMILTPHPLEMSRLCGEPVLKIQKDRENTALRQAREYGATVLLKGKNTVIADEKGRFMVNTTGNSGMAKGGSGDILAGIIGSFCAQGLRPFEATGISAYIHGAAGDICAKRLSEYSMQPTDMIADLHEVFRLLTD